MRTQGLGLLCGLTALLAGCGGPPTGCADIGGDPGVQITADAYLSDVTAGHTVEVCADGACGTAPLDGPFPFVALDDLREETATALVVVVRDQQGPRAPGAGRAGRVAPALVAVETPEIVPLPRGGRGRGPGPDRRWSSTVPVLVDGPAACGRRPASRLFGHHPRAHDRRLPPRGASSARPAC